MFHQSSSVNFIDKLLTFLQSFFRAKRHFCWSYFEFLTDDGLDEIHQIYLCEKNFFDLMWNGFKTLSTEYIFYLRFISCTLNNDLSTTVRWKFPFIFKRILNWPGTIDNLRFLMLKIQFYLFRWHRFFLSKNMHIVITRLLHHVYINKLI